MNEEFAGVRETILGQIDEAALARIQGWDSLAAFAERIVLDGVEITSIQGANGKWFARGVVSLGLFNWDEERFGEVRLHLVASGHLNGPVAHDRQPDHFAGPTLRRRNCSKPGSNAALDIASVVIRAQGPQRLYNPE